MYTLMCKQRDINVHVSMVVKLELYFTKRWYATKICNIIFVSFADCICFTIISNPAGDIEQQTYNHREFAYFPPSVAIKLRN